MVNDRKERKVLLRPVNPLFILLTLVAAMVLNFIPLKPVVWRPDILAVVLVFWCIHEPKRLHFSVAFFLGLVMDVHNTELLGQNALAYVLICLVAVGGSRRILWFDLKRQVLHVLPIFILLHTVSIFVHWVKGDVGLSTMVLIAPLIESALWVVADFVLLAPQRRAPDKKGAL